MRYLEPRKICGLASRVCLPAFLWACLPLSPAAAQAPPPVPPVKVEEIFPLPSFCVAEGLQEAGPLTPRYPGGTPNQPCGPTSIWVPPGNADDVATKLQPQLAAATAGSAAVTAGSAVTASASATGTASATATGTGIAPPNQFALAATDDKRSVIVFCRAIVCPLNKLVDLEEAIIGLAKPKYSYFKNYPIDSAKTGNALVKAVPVINAKLGAEVISPAQLRVESDKPLSDAELAVFEARLSNDQAAIVAAAKPPSPDDVKKQIAKDLQGPNPDIEVTSVDLPFFCQSGNLTDPPTSPGEDACPEVTQGDTCPDGTRKDGCPGQTRKVQANNVDTVMQALNAALGKTSKLTPSKDGNRILIACDTKCTGDALLIAQATIGATARLNPAFVQDIEVPKGTARLAASLLNAAPISATAITDTIVRLASDAPVPQTDLDARREYVREKGFGEPELPSVQRMFYRSAADVVGDLLSTPPPGTPAALGANAATPPITSAAESAAASAPATTSTTAAPVTTSTTAAPGTTISITNNPTAAAAPAAPAAPVPGPAPTGAVGQGMTAVGDTVVFTDTASGPAVRQRVRLLTMLDLPRPEVLMNMWSLQASSPDGKEIAKGLQKVRDLVSANNDALQHAIDYGWAYLSRQIKNPQAFFDPGFYHYVTQRFVADTPACEAQDPKALNCLTNEQRRMWGLCPAGQYCLGYSDAFKPLRPTLTNIILAMMASRNTARTVLTTIGCMEGKFEVYGRDCFPDRADLWPHIPHNTASATAEDEARQTKACLKDRRQRFLWKEGAGAGQAGIDQNNLQESKASSAISCELLDRAAVSAQRACGQPATLPLSCFTLQAASSFLPETSYSTFSLIRLNELAEERIADFEDSLPPQEQVYSASNLGVLRSAVADFLFNYKMATQFPGEFGPYALPHSAQELNARFNPLVVAFNQDVGALSRALMDEVEDDLAKQNQSSIFQLWRHNKSFIANGMLTVRGISGVESLVDTDTQNSFDSTQAQTLNAILSSITGTPAAATPAASGVQNTINVNPDGSSTSSNPSPYTGCAGGDAAAGSPLCAVAGLFKGATTATAIATALAAITPTETHSIIGRQLTLDVIPHTLPGASSAELDVRLWAQEDSAPTIYSASGSQNDYQSRIARHNVATRVRVESVKLFDVSSFTAMVQRPRAKLPIVPPLIEIPLVGSLLSIPLPASKVYHASSAIVSAIIVPTAADLAYGLVFRSDRAVFLEDKRFSRIPYSLRTLTSKYQLPETAPVFAYHDAMLQCLAAGAGCGQLKFADLPPER